MTAYLDNAATSFPKAPGVADAVHRQIAEACGNPGRASHGPALAASRLLFETRCAAAAFFGVSDERRVIFCKNATEALNIAIFGSVPEGGVVAVSGMEHNAVMRPLRFLERTKGVRIVSFGVDLAGRPDAESYKAALDAEPDLLVTTAASNVTGAVLPFEEIIADCGKRGIRTCVDGAQAAGHFPIDLGTLGADYFCCAGHKGLLGPSGTGLLVLGSGADPEPLLRGGTGSASESEEQPEDLPDRYEAGTQNAAGIAGLLTSVRYLSGIGAGAVREREDVLASRLAEGLRRIGSVRVFVPEGIGTRRTAVVSFDAAGRDIGELAHELDLRGIACRAGLHCAPGAHRSIGTFAAGGTIRFSPGLFTTEDEIDAALRAVEEIAG